ncbi:MAG: hypothetical protein D6819_04205 [Gammaproteobacteria bacterium]|nr:MAG: hypothetical protein D6819_04205 [Gammaproteobacteria bacterium]
MQRPGGLTEASEGGEGNPFSIEEAPVFGKALESQCAGLDGLGSPVLHHEMHDGLFQDMGNGLTG